MGDVQACWPRRVGAACKGRGVAVNELDVVESAAGAVELASRHSPWMRGLLALVSLLAVVSLVDPTGRAAWVAAALWFAAESSQAWAAMVPALQAAFTPHFPHA